MLLLSAIAVLAAGAPHMAPFMADECLLAMPDVDSLDYTMKEYMNYVEHVKSCVARLNAQGKKVGEITRSFLASSSFILGGDWTPHKVELAIWTHYVACDLKPELLSDLPSAATDESSNSKAASQQNSDTSTTPAEAASEDDSNGPPIHDESSKEAPNDAKGSTQLSEVNGEEEKTHSSNEGSNGNGHISSEESSSPPVTSNGNGVAKESEEPSKETHDQQPTGESSDGSVANGSAEKQENGSSKVSLLLGLLSSHQMVVAMKSASCFP